MTREEPAGTANYSITPERAGPAAVGRGKNNPKCIRRQRVKGHVTSDNVNTWRFETTPRLTLAVCFLADENDKVLTNDKIRIADYTQQETNGALGLLGQWFERSRQHFI